uniref:Ig-like domain-containing protein n=1 Tax=Musca domestica TaxID=7370 RepID=A0A1I8MZ03_MUSDO
MEAFHIKPQTPVESPLRTDKRIRKNCRTKERTVQGLYATAAAEELYSQSCKKNGLYQHHLQQNQGHYQKYHHRGQQPHHPQPQQQQQHLSHDHWTCIMMTMLFVISIVLTGNSALAAQRESFKPKDPNTINNNANAILNEISSGSSGSGSSNGNGGFNGGGIAGGNTPGHGNTNNISNGNSNANSGGSGTPANTLKTFHSTTSSSSSASSSGHGWVSGSGGYATTSTTSTTQTSIANHTQSSGGSSSISTTAYKTQSSHSSAAINRNAIEQPEMVQNGPYFDKAASKNVTALLGKTAYLNCRVKNLGNKTMLLQVSWVRHRDIHLLTVGRYTYTSDQRFRAIHQPQTEDWILQIKYPQHRDSGIYECQVSTTPHMSHYIHLNVVEPSTEIIGAPDLYIESGSTINLTCVILNSPEPPAYIFWNHNNAIINYDSPRGGVSVVTIKGDTTTSFLLIKSARPSDSGHYQCNPSNAKPKSVTVHVLNGKIFTVVSEDEGGYICADIVK